MTGVSGLAARYPIHATVDISMAQDKAPVTKPVCHGERMMRTGHTGQSDIKPSSSDTGQPKMKVGIRNHHR